LARSTVWNRDRRIAQDMPDATEDQKEISRRDNAIQKVVVSDTLKEDETAPWSDTTRIVRRKGWGPVAQADRYPDRRRLRQPLDPVRRHPPVTLNDLRATTR
jgi:hypothetical protein